MGRPRKLGPEEGKVCHIWMELKHLEEIDALAEKMGLTRSRLMRNLTLSGLDTARVMDAVGLFTLCRKLEGFSLAPGEPVLATK